MSRFFGAAADSASESEDSYDDNTNAVVENKFAAYDSSSDDEEKREVRSEKVKRYDELNGSIKRMKRFMRNNDWVEVVTELKAYKKLIDKAQKLFRKQGGTPDFVVTQFAYLRKVVEDKKSKKGEAKLSKTASKSLNQLSQVVRKDCQQYRKELERLEKDGLLNFEEEQQPEEEPELDEEKDLDEDEDGEEDGEVGIEEGAGKGDFSDDWSDEEDGDEDSDSSVDIPTEGIKGITREFWVKKTTTEGEKKKRERVQRERKKEKKVVADKKSELSAEAVIKKLKDIEEKRGRRGIDKREYINELKMLRGKAKETATRLKIETLLATAYFDISLNTGKAMPMRYWKECMAILDRILDTLEKEKNIRLSEDEEIDENWEEQELDDEKKEGKDKKAPETIYIHGNMFSFVSRLSSNFSQSLHEVDEHDASYVSRLQDEVPLVGIIARCEKYYTKLGKGDLLVNIKLLHLTHVYYQYKKDQDVFSQKNSSRGYLMMPKPLFTEQKSIVYDLVMHLYHAEGARTKTIALLCHVYHNCIHNRFMEARNMLLMSHLQDVIHNADIESRILYNRTLAQLGLCAFRNGFYGASLDCLSELYLYPNRIKELLAQGVTSQRYHERNLEKEKLERMREYPYHMHMNLDMLEAVNLMSAMFAEIPNLAKHGKRKVISRSFRKQYDHHKKQAFTGPPESTRHLVMSAGDALAVGDWEKCYKYLCQLRMWSLMPHAEAVQEKLKKQIQESSLQIYLLVYGPQYCSIDVKQLMSMFGIDLKVAHKVVSRMMLRGELLGAWDQPSGCIVMHNEELTRLQHNALNFADKVSQYVEMNEKLLDLRNYYKSAEYQRSKEQKSQQSKGGGYKPRAYSRKGQMSRTSRY